MERKAEVAGKEVGSVTGSIEYAKWGVAVKNLTRN